VTRDERYGIDLSITDQVAEIGKAAVPDIGVVRRISSTPGLIMPPCSWRASRP
jgi:hypothetical protein